MPMRENPFMRLCYTCVSVFGTMDVELDDAMWWLKWRSEELEQAKKEAKKWEM